MRKIAGAVLAALCALAAAMPVRAGPAQSPSVPPSHSLTAGDLEAWLDGYLPRALQRGDVAGAVVVVVKDGQVLLQKGYGYADVARRVPVDPRTTLFRPGSDSKLITWTAVMQQVEQGRIDLDRDVNAYLDFRIPPFRGRPVTMRNLMTHTAGFEYSLRDLVTADARAAPGLRDYLIGNLPRRRYPPGEVPAYSNYGAALAGYIVQRTSGEPFEAYVERHIFRPLGMSASTFRQPLPRALAPRVSGSYHLASLPPEPFETLVAPAGGASVPAPDMARFMIAHLQDGAFGDTRILQPATARLMHDTRLTTISPALNRMALGFWEMNRNGHRIIGHDGDTIWFHSALQLYPDDHVGIFLSQNSLGQDRAARAIRQGLVEGFADRYFPGEIPAVRTPAASARAHAAVLAGQYETSQSEPSTFLSLSDLVRQVTVTADDQGVITASNAQDLDGRLKRFEEIGPYVWREVGGQERLAAKIANGRVAMWAWGGEAPDEAFTPVPAWRDARWLGPALIAALMILSLTAVSWPVRAFARWRFAAPFPFEGVSAWTYRLTHAAAAASVLVMGAWLSTVYWIANTLSVASAIDPWILTLHLLSIAVFPATALIALLHLQGRFTGRPGWRSLPALAWNGLVALSTLTLLWVALLYRLIGLGARF